jgi:hypothetical protein
VFVAQRDVPCASAVRAIADESDQETLNTHCSAPWRRRQVRRGG